MSEREKARERCAECPHQRRYHHAGWIDGAGNIVRAAHCSLCPVPGARVRNYHEFKEADRGK